MRSITVTRGIVAKTPVELPVGDVERDHPVGAALQQAVGEPAGRGADVEAGAPGDVDPKRVEGVLELDPAARDVALRLGQRQLGVLGDELARLRSRTARPVRSARGPRARTPPRSFSS